MVWCFIYLFDRLKKDEILNLFQSAEFIIAIAIFLYFGTTLFVQLLKDYVLKYMREIGLVFHFVDICIMIVNYFLIGIGLSKKKLQKI